MTQARALVSQEDTSLPPGTFHLIRNTEGSERRVLELDPTPSEDPNDPLNWSTARKALNFTLINAVTIVIFTGLSTQLLFWQQMVPDLNVTYAQLNKAVSINNAGLTVGCVFFIPLAKKYGRRPVYIVSTLVMAAMAFWSAAMKTVAELYITQLITGLAGAINETIVQMTIADLFFVHHRGTMNALYITSVMIGSFLTSIPAGVQGVTEGWRWSYWTLGIANAIVFVLFVFLFEETKYVPLVTSISRVESTATTSAGNAGLVNSSAKDQHGSELSDCATTGDSKYSHTLEQVKSSPHDSERSTLHERGTRSHINPEIPLNTYRQRLRWTTTTNESYIKMFVAPFTVLFGFPHVMFTALQYGSGVVWLTILSAILSQVYSGPPYNFNSAGIGYMSIGPFIGNTFGSLYGGVMGDWAIKFFSRRNKGYYEPEFRLYLLHIPAITMAGGLIMFGATTDKGLHWIWPSIGGALFAFGLGAIGDASLTLIIDTYRGMTGEAFVGIAFVRNLFGIAVPFGISPWLASTSLTNIFITCGFISLAISSLFVPLIFYGKRIRIRLAGKYYRVIERQGTGDRAM